MNQTYADLYVINKPKEPDYGFRYKSIRNRMSFWWDYRKHTCDHCIKYIIDDCGTKSNTPACKNIVFNKKIASNQYKMTHLKKKTTWHNRIGNLMFKKDINQLLCENKEVK